jgi:outer membrane protein TolC
MKKAALILLLACAAALPAEVTLSQAVRDAWALSPGLDSQRLEEQAAAVARLTALRQKYFSVLFGGSYRYSSDKVQVKAGDFPFPLGPAVPSGAVILSAPDHTVDLRLALQQPLYSGGVLDNAVRIEEGRMLSQREMVRLKRIEIAGAVKSSYHSHRLYRCRRDSLASLLSSLEAHLRRVERLHAEELARRSDLLETRAKANEVRLGLEDLEQLIAAEAVRFRSLCGRDPDKVDSAAGGGRESFAAAWDSFLAGHPLLRSLDERARILRLQRRSLAGAYLPQIGAFAELHYGRPGQNFFAEGWTLYFSGGVSVSLPVFNWNRRGRDLELADISLRQLENQRGDFVRESERGLRQLFLQRESLERKRDLLEHLAADAEEDERLKQKLYEEGQIDHADLLAAMTSREKYLAERGGLDAQLDLLAANIDTLSGTCEEEE